MDVTVIDQATAVTKLTTTRDALAVAVDRLTKATDALVDLIVEVRPQGLLTVDEMATAMGRDRNYVDRLWSLHGSTTKGQQTRIPVTEQTSAVAARKAYDFLATAAEAQRKALEAVTLARAERNRVVVMVYSSKLLRNSAIAVHAGIDRNHVLRIARKAGVGPVYRSDTVNQYTG